MSRLGTSKQWRPQTALYDYNYGIGINFYQPMVDYIEEKERGAAGGRRTQLPHLPWSDELGLDQYDPRKIKSYSDEALNRAASRTEASAKERLRDFRATTKSGFQLSKSVSAATITEKVHRESRKKKEILRQIKTLKTNMADIDYNPNEKKDIEMALRGAQKHLRGRSAKGIEAYLQSESMKNLAQGMEFDVQTSRKFQQHQQQRRKVVSSSSSYDCVSHSQVMDRRMQEQLEDSFVEPLERLNAQLKGFDKRTAFFYYDKR